MKKLVLAAALLLGISHWSTAQTTPAAAKATALTSLESHVGQYYTDLQQRLHEAYFAPSDGRAISLLSNLLTEFTARRKALLTEAQPTGRLPAAPAAWNQEYQALLSSAAATKIAIRRQRNPALDQAFKRFDAARLSTLQPTISSTEQ